MNLSKYFPLIFFGIILILSACSSGENKASNKMEGIELKLAMNKQEISINDEVIMQVTLSNHHHSERKIFIPLPKEMEKGISAVMIEKKNQMQWQLLSPQNSQDISNIKERSFYDYVLVELGPNETIEQEFRWNQELLNQESGDVVDADGGKYIISAFIILDELSSQEEYLGPEKQLIAKLNFTVK